MGFTNEDLQGIGDAMKTRGIVRDEVAKLIKEMKKGFISDGWTSVEEELPDKDGLYLITVEVNTACCSRITKTAKFCGDIEETFGLPIRGYMWYRDGASGYPETAETKFEHVVAWMPWPEPYHGRKDGAT